MTPDGSVHAQKATLDGDTLVVEDAQITSHGLDVRVASATLHLDSGDIEAQSVAGANLVAERFVRAGDSLSLAGVTLAGVVRGDAATRSVRGWTVDDGALVSGDLPVFWFSGDLPDDHRRAGVLPPWLAWRDGVAETGAGAFLPLGGSDVSLGVFGDLDGQTGGEARLRHVGGDLRLTAPMRDTADSSAGAAVLGRGAVDPAELPSLRYDMDWVSDPRLVGALRQHPWQDARLGRRLGAPGRSEAALGIRTWSATTDLVGSVWQPLAGPQLERVDTDLAIAFDALRLVELDLRLRAASTGRAGSVGPTDTATLRTRARAPMRLGRFARLRTAFDLDVATASFDVPRDDGPAQLSAAHALAAGASARVDARLRNLGVHTVDLEAGAWVRAARIEYGTPRAHTDRETPESAFAGRIGQRFDGIGLRLDAGFVQMRFVDRHAPTRAGARARYAWLYSQVDGHLAQPGRWAGAVGARADAGRATVDVAARRVAADRDWSAHPADPLPWQLSAAASQGGAATGVTGQVDTPVCPGCPWFVGAQFFVPVEGADRAPEVGGWLALGDHDGLRLELRAFRRRDPRSFDALATASFEGF